MEGGEIMHPALVVFTSRPNSHPFQERQIYVHEPVKIGRSVARAHPDPSNAIFDCKVLSRNHALLWYEEGKFYLQDTKSSNGTFVNNQRLSRGSEESEPHEIFSGDIIQFGVDVMENSKKVTHGCIMASITLYLPDGTEPRPRFSGQNQHSAQTNSHSQEMFQLSQYLQEALHREQILQDKLNHMQTLLQSTVESCDSSWHALINEDRLLSKIEVLQNQLSVFSKSQTEGSLQQQIISMEDERLRYEECSKQSLQKVLDEQLAAKQELSVVQQSLENAHADCKRLTVLHSETQAELAMLAEKHDQKLMELHSLQLKIQEVEQRVATECESFNKDRELLQAQLEEALDERDTLQSRLLYLEAKQDTKDTTAADIISDPETSGAEINGNGSHSPEGAVETQEELQRKLEVANEEINKYLDQISEGEQELSDRCQEVNKLNCQLDQAQLEIVEYVTKVAKLEARLRDAEEGGSASVSSATADIEAKLEAYKDTSEQTIAKLKAELESVNTSGAGTDTTDAIEMANATEAAHHEEEAVELREKLAEAERTANSMQGQINQIQEQLETEQKLHATARAEADQAADKLAKTESKMEQQAKTTTEYREKSEKLAEQLSQMSEKHQEQSQQVKLNNHQLQKKVEDSKKEFDALKEECSCLRSRIQVIEAEMKRLQDDNSKLNKDVAKTTADNQSLSDSFSKLKESYEELEQLKESLESKEISMQSNLTDTQKEAQLLQEKLEAERSKHEALVSQYDEAVAKLDEAKRRIETEQEKQSENDEKLESLKKQLASVQEEYSQLAERSKTLSTLSTIPLLALMLAVVLALYPFLTRLSATEGAAEL